MLLEQNQEQETKSIIISNYLYGLITFLGNRGIPFKELDGGRIQIFYPSENMLFHIGYHFGRYAEMQNN